MTRNTTNRAVIEQWDAGYPRVSTDMQVERDALQNQVQALEAHAVAHALNLRLYKEEGVSAKDTDRPALQALIRDVRAGHVRSVVITKLDRISRSLSDLLDLMKLFEEHGVKFISLRDNIDTSGPVGRFMLHILGAIAELERAITAERVAEDMKLRAKRGKWNGGLSPYGRRVEDGQLRIVQEEAAVLHRMRQLLLEHRTWRGVAITLNRAGLRTRGWEAVERDGHLVRKGHEPAEWTPWAVKRILLQRINEGTRVYNRRSTRGRKIVPRPEEEHVVVPNYCEPIFSHEEMDELLRVAAEIEGTPPRAATSTHLLSGLVYCTCGTKMYGVNGYVNSKRGRYKVVYYRCRRASHSGTCSAKQIPAHVVEPVLVEALQKLSLDRSQLEAVTEEARAAFEAAYRPLCEQREEASKELERVRAKLASLLELAEDRLITKEEYASRKARLEGDRDTLEARVATIDAELAARADMTVDIDAVVAGLRRLSDVYDELEDVADRRRLLAHCVSKVVVKPSELDLHLPAYPLLVRPTGDAASTPEAPGAGTSTVPSQCHSSPSGRPRKGRTGAEKWADSPGHAQSASSNRVGVRGRMDVPAATTATPTSRAPARPRS